MKSFDCFMKKIIAIKSKKYLHTERLSQCYDYLTREKCPKYSLPLGSMARYQ